MIHSTSPWSDYFLSREPLAYCQDSPPRYPTESALTNSIPRRQQLPQQPKAMSSNLPLEIAETIQTASIKSDPSPEHDLNPSTSASQKAPAALSKASASDSSCLNKYIYEDEDIEAVIGEEEEEDIPYSVIKPIPRRTEFPPLPDLRFEQSYLASIAGANTRWKVAYITFRDQVCSVPQRPLMC